MLTLRSFHIVAFSALAATVLATASPAQFVTPRITLQVADWIPAWDASIGGGWGVVPTNTQPGQWTAFSSSARQLTVQAGRYDVYWLQRAGVPPLLLAFDLNVGPNGAAVAVNTGLRLTAADWAKFDGSAHWAAIARSRPGTIVAEATGNAMMLPPGDYDVYWNAGTDAGLGWVVGINITPPSGSIGMQVQALPEGVRVLATIPGGPADRAGLRVGDLITAVDGKSTVGLDSNTALAVLRGPPSSVATFTLVRANASQTVGLTRDAQQAIPAIAIDSGVRLRLPAGTPANFDARSGWWGAVHAGASIATSVPLNRSRDFSHPLPLPPSTYDIYWVANDNTPAAPLAKGVVVSAGKITEAAAAP